MKNFIALFIFILTLFKASAAIASDVLDVNLYIKDHKFYPHELELPMGKKIRIIVHNEDQTIEEFESTDLKREKIVPGKSKATIILAPLKAGIYKFFGEFHEETAQGIIIVKDNVKNEA